MKKTMLTLVPVFCLAWSLQAEDAAKRTQRSEAGAPVAKSQKPAAAAGDRSAAGNGEVVATNFTVQAGTCASFDSSLDYITSSNVSISLLSTNGQDMSATRIIPLFAVDSNAIYVAAGHIIRASDFYYVDGGSAVVPVDGRYLRIRICNDASFDILYSQLTARGSAS